MEVSSQVQVELNCLAVRSESSLIRWAVTAFNLPAEPLPYTSYSADFTCGRIASHVAKSRTFYVVSLKHAWLASLTVRRLLFGSNGWSSRLGYQLMHDDRIAVHFGT